MEEKSIITNERRFYPLLVSSSGLSPQTDSESVIVWKHLSQIPEQNKKVLLSASIIENLYRAEQRFQWQPYCSARLAYFVRELFFQNISQTEFYKAIEGLLLPQYQTQFNEILSYVNNTLLTSQPDLEEVEEDEEQETFPVPENVKPYALLDALAKYPNLGNQFLTTENIKLKSQIAPVRPTLSNWLKNYRDELGIGKHDAVTRAKFLFESLNTRKLSSGERERIHAVLRSIEDNELIAVDTKKQEIIFPQEKNTGANRASEKPFLPGQESASPDIFERFQNISGPEELKNVGTPTYATRQPQTQTRENNNEEQVLSRIKNMTVPAVSANAPAPKEEFLPAGSIKQERPAEESLGTLRFSAKHVLPAERKNQTVVPAPASPPQPSRLEHFRPQEVPIPDFRETTARPTTSTRPPYEATIPQAREGAPSVPTAPSTIPSPQSAMPIAPKPASPVSSPQSIFRIKPNRD